MFDWTTTGALILGFSLVLYITRRAFSIRNSCPLPPGPPGLPWIGNVIGVDASAPWVTYARWARTYGDIMYCKLLGKDVIIINSEKVAKDLLETQYTNYLDRPHLIISEMLGLGFNSGLLPYGDRWRLHRRIFHQTFRPEAASRFLPLQYRKACQLLRQLFVTPEELDEHLFEYTASVIMNSTYNYDVVSHKDEIVDMAANVASIVVEAARPDISIIAGVLPFLLYLPSWFPVFPFKAKLSTMRAQVEKYLEQPFEHSLLKAEVANDDIEPSMVHDGLKYMKQKGDSSEGAYMQALKGAAGTALLAGSDSSHSILLTFFLLMMLNPDVQEKAQAQIDAVVGRTRLPTMGDRPSLPFVDGIFREIFRYNPFAPLSVPRAALSDDVYNGFRIPKGAIILTNVWSMAHDEARYPNSHAFLPERFLNDDGSLKPNDLEHVAFGYGRRMCPGRHFTDTSVWGVMAKVLAVFKVLKPLDENGLEITIKPTFISGITLRPTPFKCRIVPRFPGMNAEKLEEWIAAGAA